MPNKNSTRELDDSGSQNLFLPLPCERQISTHRGARLLASTSYANPAFSYLAVVLVSALRGFQSPEGEKTEISLL
jgi:hypothetical protein